MPNPRQMTEPSRLKSRLTEDLTAESSGDSIVKITAPDTEDVVRPSHQDSQADEAVQLPIGPQPASRQ